DRPNNAPAQVRRNLAPEQLTFGPAQHLPLDRHAQGVVEPGQMRLLKLRVERRTDDLRDATDILAAACHDYSRRNRQPTKSPFSQSRGAGISRTAGPTSAAGAVPRSNPFS